MREPLRPWRSSFCTTSLCACGQYQRRAQRPAVDDVADQIDRVGFVVAEEIEQPVGLAAARAEMHVGDEKRAKPSAMAFCRHERAEAFVSICGRSMYAGAISRVRDDEVYDTRELTLTCIVPMPPLAAARAASASRCGSRNRTSV